METPKYIAVAGTIGAGKSTLVEFLCRHYDLRPFYEGNAENPYLADFYKDMRRWAFSSQIFFLAHKFKLHQALDHALGQRTVVLDRTIYEDAEIFAENLFREGHLEERDYQTYGEFYRTIAKAIRPPDLLIYLKAPQKTLRKRIELRGRREEQAVSPKYLQRLAALYEAWFERYSLSETVVVDTGKLDYIQDLVDRIDLLKTIEKYL